MTARDVHRPLVTLVLVGATLLVLRAAWAQTAPNSGATNIVKNRPAATISDSDLRIAAAAIIPIAREILPRLTILIGCPQAEPLRASFAG